MLPLSSRLDGLVRSPIRRYTNLGRETPGCILLTLGEPDLPTPEPICQAACRALAAGMTHYAPNQGLLSLRQAIAAREGCRPEQVLITQGATGALFTALLGILNPGDEVIVPTPAFNLYETIIRIAGGVAVPLPLQSWGYQISEQALADCITPRTRAILLNSPNNPTGAVLSDASLAAVKAAVTGREIYVVCDEVYRALSYGPCPRLWGDPELAGQLLLCQSFSKPYAMTGWRVGYLAAPEETIQRLLLLHAAEVAAVPTFLQEACVAALEVDTGPIRDIYRARRDALCSRLDRMGLTYPAPMGAFYVFADISRFDLDDDRFCLELIRRAGVAAVPGSCFGAPGHIRLSYACSMESLREAADRMERFLFRQD